LQAVDGAALNERAKRLMPGRRKPNEAILTFCLTDECACLYKRGNKEQFRIAFPGI
jgi:hypothetical protein